MAINPKGYAAGVNDLRRIAKKLGIHFDDFVIQIGKAAKDTKGKLAPDLENLHKSVLARRATRKKDRFSPGPGFIASQDTNKAIPAHVRRNIKSKAGRKTAASKRRQRGEVEDLYMAGKITPREFQERMAAINSGKKFSQYLNLRPVDEKAAKKWSRILGDIKN